MTCVNHSKILLKYSSHHYLILRSFMFAKRVTNFENKSHDGDIALADMKIHYKTITRMSRDPDL